MDLHDTQDLVVSVVTIFTLSILALSLEGLMKDVMRPEEIINEDLQKDLDTHIFEVAEEIRRDFS